MYVYKGINMYLSREVVGAIQNIYYVCGPITYANICNTSRLKREKNSLPFYILYVWFFPQFVPNRMLKGQIDEK